MSESLYRAVTQAVREAGSLLSRRELAAQVSQKGKTDFVTEVDRSVQELLKERLAALTPDVPLMSEEQDNSGLDLTGPVWILDPVDGTTNLIHNFRHSAISLALADGGALRFGVVYNPFHGELFSAAAGAGAFCNGEPIHVRAVTALQDALCSVGTNPGQRQQAGLAFRRMRAVYDRCHDVRRIGAASLELCDVAAGRLDAYAEHGLHPWDYAAGMLILREAGGTVTTAEGCVPSLRTVSDIAASGSAIHAEFLSVLQGA